MNIILASKSPRRQELLKLLNLEFTIEVSHVEESYDQNLKPHEVVTYLSNIKAESIFKRNPHSLIIGSDTIVSLDNTILEKPRNKEHAFEMLKTLSSKTHQVFTGVTILSDTINDSFYTSCDVTFYPLTDTEINDYIDTNEPFDKAGAYGIQGFASKFIKEIKGDYYTVVGLPVATLYQKLKHHKVI